MNHMPATGRCGLDLYLGRPGEPRFCSVTKYDLKATAYEYKLLDMGTGTPTGSGAGLKAATINFPPYAYTGRLIFYGSSITQGGCASRPGRPGSGPAHRSDPRSSPAGSRLRTQLRQHRAVPPDATAVHPDLPGSTPARPHSGGLVHPLCFRSGG